MKVTPVPIAAIDDSARARPVTAAVAEQLARDIGERGLRQPIEVTAVGKGRWRLIFGAHRLAACRLLRWETIPAVEVKGSAPELRRDELLENLARNELSKLERAQSLAELKEVFQQLNPETRAGGDRRSARAIKSQPLAFDGAVAARGPWAKSTIKESVMIGERLAPAAVTRLRGTPFEDNQSQLLALARLPAKDQTRVAELLTRGKGAASSVAEAVARIQGKAKPNQTERSLKTLMDRWQRAPKAVRRAFVESLDDEDIAEIAALRGYALVREEAA